MQNNTPINFYIKHFFINCQIKKLQLIFDTFVPPCILIRKGKPLYPFLSKLRARRTVRFGIVKVYMEKECRKMQFMYNIQDVPPKKRRVHSSLIYQRILIIYTSN
jgi:hypothetical protein